MVHQQTHYGCDKCNESYSTAEAAAQCEYEHDLRKRVTALADLRDESVNAMYVELITWVDRALDGSTVGFGTDECPRCESLVHETWMECPGCNVLLHDHGTSGTLQCGKCGNTDLTLMRKDGVTKGLGVRCSDCNSYVAHGTGVFAVGRGDTTGAWLDGA